MTQAMMMLIMLLECVKKRSLHVAQTNAGWEEGPEKAYNSLTYTAAQYVTQSQS